MMPIDDLKKIIETAIPGARVLVRDLNGGLDHFHVEVVSETFRGKTLIEQHQMVQKPLRAAIDDDRIHALTIKTYLPESYAKKSNDLISLE